MTEEQAARKIESMMREDQELAQYISEGLAEQAVSAVEGPSLKVAMFIWGLCCAIDNIGWLVVYHRNKDKFTED